MRPKNEVWQGYCGYWQDLFIRENLLSLGHAAWQGFTTQGRGIVVCDVAIIEAKSVDWNSDVVKYTVRFVPLPDIPAYLQALNLETTLTDYLLDIAQTYDPIQHVLLLINENGRADINWLEHLAISPADCYQQMEPRWSEFQLEDPAHGGCYE
ncbi:hypothetical protein [Leptothermofonsia sp. ETS-13]|uniref:hypothetical protein n=1 Tax=Leptothermofonsia sp. ETS-13 TaxID=3035696 RepID=UPI003BA37E18